MRRSQPPVVQIRARDDLNRPDVWPAGIPAVRQLLEDGLQMDSGVTFLVGENGSGKSTILEGIALAYGMSPEGGQRRTCPTTTTCAALGKDLGTTE